MEKKRKTLYLPKNKPEFIDVPDLKFLTLSGEGSPADPVFTEVIGALYSVAYTIKCSLKKNNVQPSGYYDFTVYPLEGVRYGTLIIKRRRRFQGR